jgi:hypothetical protein
MFSMRVWLNSISAVILHMTINLHSMMCSRHLSTSKLSHLDLIIDTRQLASFPRSSTYVVTIMARSRDDYQWNDTTESLHYEPCSHVTCLITLVTFHNRLHLSDLNECFSFGKYLLSYSVEYVLSWAFDAIRVCSIDHESTVYFR